MSQKSETSERSITNILVADDDRSFRKMLALQLQRAGYNIVEAEDGVQAQELMSEDIGLVMLDLYMPGPSGIECLTNILERFPSTPAIVLSSSGEINDAIRAIESGAFWYLRKPYDPAELLVLIDRAASNSNLIDRNHILRSAISTPTEPAQLRGSSDALDDIKNRVQNVAAVDSAVLVTGESGTGKTTLARLIHQMGPRRNGPFVSVSCAAIPHDLLESELFGHERGAFTGAVTSRPGRAEIADGGTLFLDEIGDMPLSLQPKLLTFLQEHISSRVGSSEEREIDTRIIAATNHDLLALCEQRLFREDLYYRLNVIKLEMPALRNRKEDITYLSEDILGKITAHRNSTPFSLADDALQKLMNYDWPGNIRELQNILEAATAFCQGSRITAQDLELGTSSGTSSSEPSTSSFVSGKTLAEVERAAIAEAIKAANGNKTEAAKALGISKRSIFNKINSYGESFLLEIEK